MSWLKNLIKFLWDDTKEDIKFLNKVGKGEYDYKAFGDKLKHAFKSISFTDILKENWLFLLLLVIAFLSGAMLGGKYYEMKAHNILIEQLGIVYDQCAPHIKDKLIFDFMNATG